MKKSDRFGCLNATYELGMVYSRCQDPRFKGTDIVKFTEGAEKGDLRCIDALIRIYESKNHSKADYWKNRFDEEDCKVHWFDWKSTI